MSGAAVEPVELLTLLKLGCEVHLDAFPADCPRRRHTFECEAYHRTSQAVFRTTRPHYSPAEAYAEVLAALRASM